MRWLRPTSSLSDADKCMPSEREPSSEVAGRRSQPLTPSRTDQSFTTSDEAAAQAALKVQFLREDLDHVSKACTEAASKPGPGRLFFLLRKKWQLTQALFEAENHLRLLR
jgi:hypothetical protein